MGAGGEATVGGGEILEVERAGASLISVKVGKPQVPFCAGESRGRTHPGRSAPPPGGGELVWFCWGIGSVVLSWAAGGPGDMLGSRRS